MSDHEFAKKLRTIMHRDPEARALQGRMRLVTCQEQAEERSRFEQIMSNSDDIILTTGCGLPDKLEQLPVRFPSLIVPGLQMIRMYHQAFGNDRKISYQVYQAGEFIKKINQVDEKELSRTASFMQGYLQQFTDTYFPDIAHLVHFDFKKDIDLSELEKIKKTLDATDDIKAQEYLHKIKGYSMKDNGRGCALTYAAANVFFNGLNDQNIERPTTVLPIGGQKEVPFFYLTSLYHQKNIQQKNVTVLPISFNCQQLPSYYSYQNKDVTIGALAKENMATVIEQAKVLPYPALKDYKEILEPIGATLADLAFMAQSIRHASTQAVASL